VTTSADPDLAGNVLLACAAQCARAIPLPLSGRLPHFWGVDDDGFELEESTNIPTMWSVKNYNSVALFVRAAVNVQKALR